MLRHDNTTTTTFSQGFRSALKRFDADAANHPSSGRDMSHPDASGSANGLPSFSKNNPDARASGTAPQGPESTASGGALGSNRELFHPRVSRQALNRREMRADQRAASAIYFKEYRNLAASGASHDDLKSLPAAGVGGCGLSQIAEMETLLQRREISEGQFKAFVSGVRVCGLRWVCQHCAAKAAEDDRKAVNAGIAAGRARGLIPVMLTLTTRHSREDEAGTLLNAIARAEQRVKRLKCWENLPFAGYARVLEWTYGENGHHPHFHTILLMRAGSEAEAVEMVKRIQPSYMGQLAKAGRDGTSKSAWKHSFQVQGAAAASSYITKWGAAEELTGAQHKSGKHGFTHWQLLRLARTGKCEGMTPVQARAFFGARWWEVMVAVKGRAQLYKSDGFKELAAEYLDEHPADEPPEPETVLSLGTRQKRGEQTLLWSLAAPSLLAMKETVERIEDLAEASETVRQALYAGTLPTDTEILNDVQEPDDDLIETEPVSSG
jgi:hypothetical protein